MPLQEGQSILNGEYRILSPIGEGGFGTVWRALEVKSQVEVAIKEARSGSEEAEQRFAREIKISRRMDHPNILKADSVREEGGTLYLIMPFVQGGSLRQRLERGPLPIPDAVDIATAVADGLGYLHGKDLVHRDVHPGNILFTREGVVKLVDLGLVQSPDFSASLWSGEKEGRHPGNLYYIAPEAIAEPGRPLVPLYPAADVYMLGAVLWEMLTGRVYYNQKGHAPSTLRPEVSPWLDDLVMRFLASKPEERPADGNEAARLLRAGQAEGEQESRRAGLYRQGQEAVARQDWAVAIQALEPLVQESADYQDAAALLAQAQAEQKKVEIAQRAAERRQQEAAVQKQGADARQRRDALVQVAWAAQNNKNWAGLQQVLRELQPLDAEAARPFAAALAAYEREEGDRQTRWDRWYNEVLSLLPTDPRKALALLDRLRREAPNYPGLAELERRARQAAPAAGTPPRRRLPVWVWLVAGLLLVAAVGWGISMLIPKPTLTPTPTPGAAPVQITLWTKEGEADGGLQYVRVLCEDYTRLHPNVTFAVVNKDIEALREDFQDASLAGSPPDLLWTVNDHAGPFVTANLIEPVDGMVDLSLYVPSVVMIGKTWAVPISSGNHLILIYNRALMPAPPATTDELLALAGTMPAGVYPLIYNQAEPFWLVPWLGGFGGKVFGDDGVTPTLDTAEMVATLQFLLDLKAKGIVPPDSDYLGADSLLKEGKAAAIINGDWSLGGYKGLANSVLLPENLGVARIAMISSTGKWPAPYTSGVYFMVPKGLSELKLAAGSRTPADAAAAMQAAAGACLVLISVDSHRVSVLASQRYTSNESVSRSRCPF